jgi:hypothetical protein
MLGPSRRNTSSKYRAVVVFPEPPKPSIKISRVSSIDFVENRSDAGHYPRPYATNMRGSVGRQPVHAGVTLRVANSNLRLPNTLTAFIDIATFAM